MKPWIIALLAVGTFACGRHAAAPEMQDIVAATVPAAELPASLDPARTYEHVFATVDPDSVLRALLRARIPVVRAWQPLDNRCMDPRGPRFTVELKRPEPRILAYDFQLGTGRLACATRLKRFTVRG